MNYQDDQEIAMILAEDAARRGMWWSVAVWLPLFVAAAGLFLFFSFDKATGGDSGTWFLLVVLAVFSLLLGFQASHSLRDVLGEPLETTGAVARTWSRTDSFVVKSHYIRIERKLFRLNSAMHREVEVGDLVWLRFFPHSGTVIALEKRQPPDKEAPVDAVDGRSPEGAGGAGGGP